MERGSVIGAAYMKTNMRVVTCVAEKRSGVDSVSSDQAATAFVSPKYTPRHLADHILSS